MEEVPHEIWFHSIPLQSKQIVYKHRERSL